MLSSSSILNLLYSDMADTVPNVLQLIDIKPIIQWYGQHSPQFSQAHRY